MFLFLIFVKFFFKKYCDSVFFKKVFLYFIQNLFGSFQIRMKTFKEVSVDYWKFNRKLISSQSISPVESRGPLRLLKVFESYNFSSREIKHIKITTAARSRATQNNHNRILTILEKFGKKGKHTKKCDLLTLSEDTLLDYLVYLDESSAKLSQLKGLKGAISFLTVALKLKDPWSLEVDRSFEAIYRRASCEKAPLQKANLLPLWVLPRALDAFITPYMDNPDKVDFIFFNSLL